MPLRPRFVTVLAASAALVACAAGERDTPRAALAQAVDAPTTLAMAPDRYFTKDGTTIRYRVIGDGDAVLLIHGYTDRVEMWNGPADSLAREFRVIVPDVRGFGASTKFARPSQYGRKMVDDMTELLDHLDVRQTHVIGYSMGAVIAAHLALESPERVRTATFVAGPFWPDSVSLERTLRPLVDTFAEGHGLSAFFHWILPTWSDSAIAAVAPQIQASNDSASLVASMRAFPGLMLDSARLAKARVPAVAIVGVQDPMLPHSRYLAQWWPKLRLVELPLGDHADITNTTSLLSEFRTLTEPH